MKIAIHKSWGFSSHWILFCENQSIDYKIVNCYDSNIMKEIEDCDALMWHIHQAKPADNLFAKQLLYSVQSSGKYVFPDFNTVWHFDDKIGQKYLMESIGAPLVPTYVFYSKEEALKWFEECNLPVVFKLRSGASSENVRLIRTKRSGKQIIDKAFGHGFKAFNKWYYFKEGIRKYREGVDGFTRVLKGFVRIFIAPDTAKSLTRQKGYVYFQDFVPENDSDVRVIVIGDKAFAIKRMVRKNDFRASGSGKILYDRCLFDENTLNLSFHLAKIIKSQVLAIDYVYLHGNPLITEISFGFSPKGYYPCPGYWDNNLNWHEGEFNPYGWMVDMVLKRL